MGKTGLSEIKEGNLQAVLTNVADKILVAMEAMQHKLIADGHIYIKNFSGGIPFSHGFILVPFTSLKHFLPAQQRDLLNGEQQNLVILTDLEGRVGIAMVGLEEFNILKIATDDLSIAMHSPLIHRLNLSVAPNPVDSIKSRMWQCAEVISSQTGVPIYVQKLEAVDESPVTLQFKIPSIPLAFGEIVHDEAEAATGTNGVEKRKFNYAEAIQYSLEHNGGYLPYSVALERFPFNAQGLSTYVGGPFKISAWAGELEAQAVPALGYRFYDRNQESKVDDEELRFTMLLRWADDLNSFTTRPSFSPLGDVLALPWIKITHIRFDTIDDPGAAVPTYAFVAIECQGEIRFAIVRVQTLHLLRTLMHQLKSGASHMGWGTVKEATGMNVAFDRLASLASEVDRLLSCLFGQQLPALFCDVDGKGKRISINPDVHCTAVAEQ